MPCIALLTYQTANAGDHLPHPSALCQHNLHLCERHNRCDLHDGFWDREEVTGKLRLLTELEKGENSRFKFCEVVETW